MIEVVDVNTMRNSDKEIIKTFGSKELMFEAGKKLYESYEYKGKVGIVCGSGNNAGDGYVLASFLPNAIVLRTSRKTSRTDSSYTRRYCNSGKCITIFKQKTWKIS